MKKIMMLAMVFGLMFTQAQAAETTFEEGKTLFQQNCLMCHDAQLDPAQAPPMFGVQMKYKMATSDKAAFVAKITDFATNPTTDKAILKEPVKILGVMPNMGFEEADVRKIAAYIHDETFAPPCNHWKHAAERFKKQGKMALYKKHQQKYDAMCSAADVQPKVKHAKAQNTAITAEQGSLQAVMQQIGMDYAALDHAILQENFTAAAEAAHAIAFHETPSLGTKMKLMAGLRTEMKAFKKADGKVHHLALDIEKAAKAKDMKALIAKQSQMLSACMACHRSFRSRVISILH
ncbi:c-type cytochrome [Ghiorsea bivora]|uniref:c-type cytochrome n=1 Tax=Ghiorsea bivora TaxID=1485545 RepID=UPI0009DDBBAF|nr:cytochrome c [Ghiorsea bivora]